MLGHSHDYSRQQSAQLLSQILSQQPDFAPHIHHVLEQLGSLGEGGMGRVFRVHDKRLGREAALKILQPSQGDMDAILRFKREAQIMARLDHPGIPPVYESGMTPEGQPFLLMKIVQGATLTERIAQYHEDGCPEDERDELLRALIKVSEAVAYAHSRGVIHRDLKPDNIMIGQYGEVLVMDWGLAKHMEEREDPRLTQASLRLSQVEAKDLGMTEDGTVLGTPGYMAPEQVSGRGVSEASDVFALAVILNQAMTNESVIPGHSAIEVLTNTVKGDYPTWSDWKAVYPMPLQEIAAQGLAMKVEARTRGADVFAEQLQSYLEAGQHSARTSGAKSWLLSLAPWFLVAAVSVFALVSVNENKGLRQLVEERAGNVKVLTRQLEAQESSAQKRQRSLVVERRLAESVSDLLAKRQRLDQIQSPERAVPLIFEIYQAWKQQSGAGRDAAWWAYKQLQRWDEAAAARHFASLLEKSPTDTRLLFEQYWQESKRVLNPNEDALNQRLKDIESLATEADSGDVYVTYSRICQNWKGLSVSLRASQATDLLAQPGGRHPAMYILRAQYYASLRKPREAHADILEALRLEPNAAYILQLSGQFRVVLGQFGQAALDFQRAALNAPNKRFEWKAKAALFRLFYTQGEWLRALNLTEQVVNDIQSSGLEGELLELFRESQLQRSYCLWRLGLREEMRTLWKQRPGLEQTAELKVFRLRNFGDSMSDEAFEKDIEALKRECPKLADLYITEALHYFKKQNVKKVQGALAQGRARAKRISFYTRAEVLALEAEMIRSIGRVADSRTLVNQVLTMGRWGQVVGRVQRAKYLFEIKKDWDGCRRVSESALRLDPNNHSALSYWVRAQLKLGHYEVVIERLLDWRGHRSEQRWDFHLGEAYLQGKQYKQAVKYLESIHRHVPKSYAVSLRLAECYGALNRRSEALPLFKKCFLRRPQEVTVGYTAALYAFQEGQTQEPLDIIEKIIAERPDFAAIYQLRSRIYQSLGRNEEASKDAAKAKELLQKRPK